MNRRPEWRTSLAPFVVAAIGCAATSPRSTDDAPDAMASARATGKPVVVLAIDSARNEADRVARDAFTSARSTDAGVAFVLLDLGVSRNRAAAAPLHAVDAPTLACLTPAGVLVSWDEGTISATLVRERTSQAVRLAPDLDRTFAGLAADVAARPDDLASRSALADFMLSRESYALAIPHLRRLADDASADVSSRVRAWTTLARAHLWCIEPEKARYAAQGLIDTLGPTSPDAIAGGNLVRGLQDTRAKRYDRARAELAAAVAAAPDSAYGRDAADLLSKLPTTAPASRPIP